MQDQRRLLPSAELYMRNNVGKNIRRSPIPFSCRTSGSIPPSHSSQMLAFHVCNKLQSVRVHIYSSSSRPFSKNIPLAFPVTTYLIQLFFTGSENVIFMKSHRHSIECKTWNTGQNIMLKIINACKQSQCSFPF